MYIDTHSYETIQKNIYSYFQTDRERLQNFFKEIAKEANKKGCCDEAVIMEYLNKFITENEPQEGKIDELIFFHLTRRLKNSEEKVCSNLKDLLITENCFSDFLKEHGFIFKIPENSNEIAVYKDNDFVQLKDDLPSSYLRKRLGYSGEPDWCINGFAFGDCLRENDYVSRLGFGPEIIIELATYFKMDKLVGDYCKNSILYQYEYKMSFRKVIFDGYEQMDENEKRQEFLNKALYRLYHYMLDEEGPNRDEGNIALRMNDNANMLEEEYIGRVPVL